MIYDVAVVRDIGEMYQVDYVTRSDLTMLDAGNSYVKISARCADAIKEAKSKGYPVFIPKGLTDEVKAEQLIIQETSELETAKNLAEYRVFSTVNEALIGLSLLDLYGYLAAFSKFAARGIFITDENVEKVKDLYTLDEAALQNRDEAYVNIVQKRNAGGDLIGHLLCEVIGVKNIRDTGFVQLSVVCCIGKAHGSMR